MKRIILTILFTFNIAGIVSANDRSNYSGYYTGYGKIIPGYQYNNRDNWNRLTLPGGQTKIWYKDGFIPSYFTNDYYPYANYSIPYYNSYMRTR